MVIVDDKDDDVGDAGLLAGITSLRDNLNFKNHTKMYNSILKSN